MLLKGEQYGTTTETVSNAVALSIPVLVVTDPAALVIHMQQGFGPCTSFGVPTVQPVIWLQYIITDGSKVFDSVSYTE